MPSAKSKTGKAAAKKAKEKVADWTVLVYMVADDPKGVGVLDQMAHRELDRITHGAMAVDRRKLNVAVQVDFRSEPFVWRRIVGVGSWARPEEQSATPEALYGFFDWVQEHCPAKKYFLIFWGHSEGPFGLFKDDDAGQYVAQTLTLPELRKALGAAKDGLGRKVDLIAFKDCFFATLEAAYELRELASFLIATQGLVPAEGWPYRELFKELVSNPSADAYAEKVLQALGKFYRDANNRPNKTDVPFSLLDTTKAEKAAGELFELTHNLLELCQSAPGRRIVADAATEAAAGDPAMLDVRKLCAGIAAAKPTGLNDAAANALKAAQAAARGLIAAIVKDLVRGHSSQNINSPGVFDGVSVFRFPSSSRPKSNVASVASRTVYEKLALSQQTKWSEVALAHMPAGPPLSKGFGSLALSASDVGDDLLPALVWDQLRRNGIVEQMQLRGIEFAQQALLGLSALGPKDDKGGNLGPGKDDKGGNLGPKGGNLGPQG